MSAPVMMSALMKSVLVPMSALIIMSEPLISELVVMSVSALIVSGLSCQHL